ncbi:30S ribosomal protein S2 [Candidatus Dependentiae bacterium]|nr:30S ribosomal protein S2 [Candidatus Dependentiae bacterium]
MIDPKVLVKNGVHYGHKASVWDPRMAPYIWGKKDDVYLIDVSKTAYLLDKAAKFLESIVASGRPILWVGTKKAAQAAVEKAGKELKLPFVTHRWIGGTLTNFRQVRKSVANFLHYKDIIVKSEQFNYTKKELNKFQKNIDKLEQNIGGIVNLTWPVGALVVVDVKKEHVAIKEAKTMGVPVVAIVDTNCDPSLIDYIIPANDDAPKSIEIIMNYLAEAVKASQAVAAEKPSEEQIIEESVVEQMIAMEPEEETEGSARKAKTQAKVVAIKAPNKKIISKRPGKPSNGKKFDDESSAA